MTQELTVQKYDAMIEEISAMITEGEFQARFTLIETYHNVGKRILEDHPEVGTSEGYGEEIVQRVAESVGKGKRTIAYAVQFAREYPDVNSIPGGKATSWRKVTKLLDGHSPDEAPCTHEALQSVNRCTDCHKIV